MIRLLKSNFSRLSMNVIFKTAIVASGIVGVICPLLGHRMLEISMITNTGFYLDYYFFRFAHVIAFAICVCCGFYVSVEYSDGTLRNKIAAGHSRAAIYISNFITNAISAGMLYTVYLIVDFCVGRPLMGAFQRFEWKEIGLLIFCAYAVMITFAAIFTLFSMLISSRTISFVICVCVLLISLFYGIRQINMLDETIFWLGEANRQIAVFFWNFLPGSQLIQFFSLSSDMGNRCPYVMLFGSAFFTAVSMMIGTALFQKKELK